MGYRTAKLRSPLIRGTPSETRSWIHPKPSPSLTLPPPPRSDGIRQRGPEQDDRAPPAGPSAFRPTRRRHRVPTDDDASAAAAAPPRTPTLAADHPAPALLFRRPAVVPLANAGAHSVSEHRALWTAHAHPRVDAPVPLGAAPRPAAGHRRRAAVPVAREMAGH
ncbi:hypothetical protein CGRA01v4_12497 [Colletotrichum graminicola]|nr:hypothetical protein CGRA01v4_12497 [Colletotrichum graminicola]